MHNKPVMDSVAPFYLEEDIVTFLSVVPNHLNAHRKPVNADDV